VTEAFESAAAPPSDGSTAIVLSTGRTVRVKELNGLQQALADGCVAGTQTQLLAYYRSAMAIVDLGDGRPVFEATGKALLDGRLQRLTGKEADELAFKYNKQFGAQMSEDDVKNVSAPGASTPAS
jgi:hypothetical protein